MFESRVISNVESVTARYPRGFTSILYVCVLLGLALAVTAIAIGLGGSVYAVMGLADIALCLWIATGTTRVDLDGVRVRSLRPRFIPSGNIASLQVKRVSRRGQSRDMIVVVNRDGSELTLDQVTMGFPAPDLGRVHSYLRDMNRVLGVDDVT